jgi:hypothetical protein
MYDLFRQPARRFTGELTFPELPYLRRSFAQQLDDVKAYYRRFPKRVDADNLLGNLLLHIPQRTDLDDRRYLRFVEDTAQGVARAFGLTSSTYRGKVHEGGVTLGSKTDEVVLVSYGVVDVNNAKRDWRNWAAYRYLYHTRTDLGMPIPNNTTPGKGYGVAVLDIPMLALQYRYWLQQQKERFEQKESVYRFIGGVVLPNTIDSYLDIAMFNRLARQAQGIGMSRFPTPHPFYLTDFSGRVDLLCQKILASQERRSDDLEQVVATTPMLVQDRLWDVLRLPKDPVTRANEWALQLARLPYVRYLIETAVRGERGDRQYLNELYTSLMEAGYDQVFAGVGSPEIVKHYRQQLRGLVALLEEKKQGWT